MSEHLCPKCGREVSEGAAECPWCGVVLSKFKPSTGAWTVSSGTPPPFPAVAPPTASTAATAEVLPQAPSAPQLTPTMIDLLRRTAPWVAFLGLVGYVEVILITALLLFTWRAMGATGRLSSLLFAYVCEIALILLGAVSLRRYASAIGRILPGQEAAAVEEALEQQRFFWKLVGMVTLVCVLLLLVAGGFFLLGRGLMTV